jgi:hypothetical protein
MGMKDNPETPPDGIKGEPSPAVTDEIRRAQKLINDIPGTGMSETTKRIREMMELPGMDGINASTKRMLELSGLTGISESTRRVMETMKIPGMDLNESTRRAIEGLAVPGFGSNDGMKIALENLNLLPKHGIDNELLRSLERTSILGREMDQKLSKMKLPAVPSPEIPHIESEWALSRHHEFITPEIPLNPIFETNKQLSELTATVRQLFDVSQQQAVFSQAIRETSDLALRHAISSGEDAKAATQLARKSIRLTLAAIVVAIVTAFLTIYDNHHLSSTTDARLKEEISVLQEMSNRLKVSVAAPADTAGTVKANAKK